MPGFFSGHKPEYQTENRSTEQLQTYYFEPHLRLTRPI